MHNYCYNETRVEELGMYLILGKQGQLGQSFIRVLEDQGLPYVAPEERQADILDVESMKSVIRDLRPTVIINCAAYTDVEQAEAHKTAAFAVNEKAIRNIAQICAEVKALCVHFSTDYVFSGESSVPYTEDNPAAPLSVYGESKLRGEYAVRESGADYLVFRTSWLYSPYGRNFYTTMYKLGNEQSELKVVVDQVGTPTYAPHLALHVLDILRQFKPEHSGVYHLGDEGVASWYDFTYAILQQGNLPCHVLPISSSDYPTKAKRPAFSVLSKDKVKGTFAVRLHHWTEGVRLCQQVFSKIS